MRALLLLLVVPLLSGCSSSGVAPEYMFQDAAHRFAATATEAFDESHDIELPAGAHTLQISARTQDGFAAYLQAPPEPEPYSGVMMPGPNNGISHSGHLHLESLQFTTVPGVAGTWTLRIGCGGPCSYAVAIDEGDVVPQTQARFRGAIEGTLTDGERQYTLDVPSDHVNITMHMENHDGITVLFDDGNGNRASGWNFNSILARGWRHEVTHAHAPGEWTIYVGCDGTCRYAFDVR